MANSDPSVLENYRAAVGANPNSAEAHANLGWGWYGQRKYAEAVTSFEKALTLDANLVDAHYGLGLALKEAGESERAVQAFEVSAKLASQLDNPIRAQMLAKLAQGHINQIQMGSWNLEHSG